jgi:hypothetical protein
MRCLGEKDEIVKKLSIENEELNKSLRTNEKDKEELEKKFEESLNKFKKELQYGLILQILSFNINFFFP